VSLRSRLTRIPYGDQTIFIKKTVYQELGGFRDIPLMEDVDLMRRLKRAGGRIVILPQKAVTSPRRWQKEGIVYCTLRNWFLIVLYLFGVPPQRLARFYR
jgi:GT2 family glycosyltransferase